jgi:hypothetical protein
MWLYLVHAPVNNGTEVAGLKLAPPLTLSHRQTKVTIFGQVERRNSWMLYWHQNSQNHASCTSIMTLILTLCHKLIHRWNQFCKGFILSHFEWVACMVHHGLLGLRLCISTIGISTTYCKEPNNYPPKRCMSATTIILTQCSKSMHRWNPLCEGFILSHFDGMLCGATLRSDTYDST